LKEGFDMDYLKAFLVGGIICAIGQLLIDKTKITPARILVLFVTSGVILGAVGIYEPLVKFGGAGATVPLPGFGYALAKGVFKEVDKTGFIGAFTGGIKGTAAGISAAIFFGYLAAIIFNPKAKS
jgi:stage V sporulation protein AE